MSVRITLDSNVLQPIVRPHRFPNDLEIDAIQAIHNAFSNGQITGLIAETMATLEAIQRADRADYFSKLKRHPGLHEILAEVFKETLSLGIRFMRCPRIGLDRPDVLEDNSFVTEVGDKVRALRQKRYFEVGNAIESRGLGIAIAKTFGQSFNDARHQSAPWFEGLAFVESQSDLNRAAKAIAEWADADAVAAHIGYQNDYFCTRDAGKSAGISVLSPENKAWLKADYGVVFVTPTELAERICH